MIKAVASYFKIFLGPFFHYRLKLNENKLTRLFSELKVLDKEHLALKRLKAENGDKDGLREAEMRKKVTFVSFRLECDLFTRRMTFLSTKRSLGSKFKIFYSSSTASCLALASSTGPRKPKTTSTSP